MTKPKLDPALTERFRRDLDPLIDRDSRIGIAVSGGPDSLALLLLAADARPGKVEAATVDHALRPESRSEAEMVAGLCEALEIPHAILTAAWDRMPETALQERARAMRYRLLDEWAHERGLAALVTAHHRDDQAETFLMRLARGAGVKGLAGMRSAAPVPGGDTLLIRPLLGWSRGELEAICAGAGIEPVRDPSNEEERFERVRMRRAIADADWLDTAAIAASAAHLADADAALDWASDQEWARSVTERDNEIVYRHGKTPSEIRRRIVRRAVLALATEGEGDLRGREIDTLLEGLAKDGRATLRGVLCNGGGAEWRFSPAPERKR